MALLFVAVVLRLLLLLRGVLLCVLGLLLGRRFGCLRGVLHTMGMRSGDVQRHVILQWTGATDKKAHVPGTGVWTVTTGTWYWHR